MTPQPPARRAKRNPIRDRFIQLCERVSYESNSNQLHGQERHMSLGAIIYRRAYLHGFAIIVSAETLLEWNGGGTLEWTQAPPPAGRRRKARR